ncbi:S-4TM family putative pore-forming effector [Nocardia jiangxiensis]|uniref:S-4TM family putative pore-forming effector n=1 Tax=Nocardia jiangxiensis TaxID=282685 RepID=A0ABW6S272_9NOCA
MAIGEFREYIVPDSRHIADNQNEVGALRLLLAQRRLYSMSKRWLSFRWLGMLVIAIMAPPVAVIWPKLAVIAGAVAGLWVFLGRTILLQLERNLTEQAAAVQERFDFTAYGMPSSGRRAKLPSLEEISLLVGPDDSIESKVQKQELRDWYPIDREQRGIVTVAICQRANVSYWDQLLKTAAKVWIVGLAFWTVALVVASFVFNLSLEQFLLGMALPLLPAALDVWEYWTSIRGASRERTEMSNAIEDKLADNASNLESGDLLIWQERLFEMRRHSPQVPDLIYKLRRKRNEAAMTTAAQLLSRQVGQGS